MKFQTLVFAGPSLTTSDMAAFAGFTFLPPIAQGDIFEAVTPNVSQIAIIDGYFGDRLAIFHKEILWAMAKGIGVAGSASMGALRAAELSQFGMKGVGRIFQSYAAGGLTSDADVAVAHGPAELGFLPTSVAQVDVDATLCSLAQRGRISRALAARLRDVSRGIYFADRTWDRIAAESGSTDAEFSVEDLASLMAGSHIEQKRLDALELLEWLRDKDAPCATERVHRFAPPMTSVFQRTLKRARRAMG
ncbi:MAG: TfuA-like protein [Pseudomonadota bacterium]